MERTVRISVIVPVFNTEACLPQCLSSLAENAHEDDEILLVDDGSTDGSSNLLDSFAESRGNVRVIRQENRGLSAARNSGLDAASGEWILFVDSDDYVLPGFFDAPYERALRDGTDLALFGTREFTDRTGYVVSRPGALQEGNYSAEDVLRALARFEISPNAVNKLFRRTLWDGIRFPEGECLEDCAVMHEVIGRARRVSVMRDLFYACRLRAGSISKEAESDLSIYRWRYLQYGKRYRYLLERYPLIASEMDRAREESAFKYCASLSVLADRGGFRQMRAFILSGKDGDGLPIPRAGDAAPAIRAARILLRSMPSVFRLASSGMLRRKKRRSPFRAEEVLS